MIFDGIFLGLLLLYPNGFTGRMLTNGCPSRLASTNESCPLQRHCRGRTVRVTASDERGPSFSLPREVGLLRCSQVEDGASSRQVSSAVQPSQPLQRRTLSQSRSDLSLPSLQRSRHGETEAGSLQAESGCVCSELSYCSAQYK